MALQDPPNSKPVLLLTGPSWPAFWWTVPSAVNRNETPFMVGGKPIYLASAEEGDHDSLVDSLPHEQKTAFSVWDCSIVLAQFLDHNQNMITADQSSPYKDLDLRNRHVLELGSGRGVVGIAAHNLGAASVTLTDIPAALPSLRTIVSLNHAASSVSVVPLDWTDPDLKPISMPVDVVLASDVVWVDALIVPLVRIIEIILKENRGALCVFAYQSRSTRADVKLFGAFEKHGLAISKIDDDHLHPVYRKDVIAVYVISVKIATKNINTQREEL
ncbi:putative methyltransferase-domain-containing protein [Cladochytrium replicatum]|nr:putative methyltransferase-domain-containing protein [Cladochytrium replicatum]